MKYLALDIGSSFLKGALLDPFARTIEQVRRVPCPEPLAGQPRLHFELDPDQVVAAVSRLLDQFRPGIDQCAGILVCGQMGGTLVCGPGGEPRGNYLSWRDQRVLVPRSAAGGPSFLDELRGRLGATEWSELGHELRPGSATALLAWLVARGQPPQPDERPCSLADFVVARLGGTDCRMEPTEAIGLIDVQRRTWHRSALRALVGAEINWPDLATWNEPIAQWSIGGRRLPCYAPLGDHQCALAGSGLGPGELSINISTGSQVSRLARQRPTSAAQTRAYFDDWLLQTVTHLPAGRSLEVLVDLLLEIPRRSGLPDIDPWPAITAAAREAADSALEVDLTFFAGPLGDHGAIRNVTLENLRLGELFRAAWRGMAGNYRRCAEWLDDEKSWSRLVFSGGLAHKLELLRQFTCEQFGCASRVCVAAEDTMQGLLALAMVLAGEAEGVVEAGQRLNAIASGDSSN